MKNDSNRTSELVKVLQDEIVSGVLKPGQKMPPLRRIAELHGVSRSVVNSAISALSAKGYLRIVPRHFIMVEDFLLSGSLDVLEDVFHSPNRELKAKMIKDVLSCRVMVETQSIHSIFLKPQINLSLLETVIFEEKKWLEDPLSSTSELPRIDLSFHDALVRLGDNMASTLIYRSFQYLAVPMVRYFYGTPNVVEFVFRKHDEIFRSLSLGKEEAAIGALRELLKHGEQTVLGLMKEGPEWFGL